MEGGGTAWTRDPGQGRRSPGPAGVSSSSGLWEHVLSVSGAATWFLNVGLHDISSRQGQQLLVPPAPFGVQPRDPGRGRWEISAAGLENRGC